MRTNFDFFSSGQNKCSSGKSSVLLLFTLLLIVFITRFLLSLRREKAGQSLPGLNSLSDSQIASVAGCAVPAVAEKELAGGSASFVDVAASVESAVGNSSLGSGKVGAFGVTPVSAT